MLVLDNAQHQAVQAGMGGRASLRKAGASIPGQKNRYATDRPTE